MILLNIALVHPLCHKESTYGLFGFHFHLMCENWSHMSNDRPEMKLSPYQFMIVSLEDGLCSSLLALPPLGSPCEVHTFISVFVSFVASSS